MEHNTEYRLKMRKKRKRARMRRWIMLGVIVGLGLIALGLCAAMLVLKGKINDEHELAVADYNSKNWQTVERIPGGKKVAGCIEGVPYSYVDDGTYFPGVSVDGIDISGKTYDEARAILIDHVAEKLSEVNMTLQVENACLVLSASDMNIKVNVNSILNEAYALGRESYEDYPANYRAQQELAANPVDYPIVYECDRDAIAERVANIAHFVNTEPKEPYVTASKHRVSETETTEVQTVHAGNGAAIGFIVYHAGKMGYTIDQEALINEVAAAFDNGEYDKEISAELHDTEPQKTIEDLKTDLKCISMYKTNFESSNLNRRRNIQKAADIINACIMEPWQEISFNQYVGPRTEQGGWLPAPGITGGKEYVDSPGGGICQVSGTLYNALLACGPNTIKITKRQHHSWPSTYVPYGLDATVDTNGPDLCWRNISSGKLIIFAYADVTEGSRNMYVYVFGKPEPDGSYYKTAAETIEEIEPEPTEYINDSQLPAGTYKTEITSRKGYVAEAYLLHYDANGNLIETILLYTDRYSPVRGRVRRGTGPA